jgi:uncharacterized protein with NRDE domain
MCIVFLAHQVHPDAPLVLLANRDEFHARPTQAMHRWSSAPFILAGRDLEANGTWLGFNDEGAFALVANYRDMRFHDFKGPSRGQLVTQFFEMDADTHVFSQWLRTHGAAYAGFNLLYGKPGDLCYYGNMEAVVRSVGQGVHGLSNGLLDSDWPKVNLGKSKLQQGMGAAELPDDARLFGILGDQSKPADEDLPDTGVGMEWERFLSSVFIAGESYGSRCGTLAVWGADQQLRVEERTYQNAPDQFSQASYVISLPV